MDVYEWEDGFTPYHATVSASGTILTEYKRDQVERVSRLARRPQWDEHENRDAYAMTNGFASGEVDGVPVAWVDGYACELLPVGDFDCCAYGTGCGGAR